MMVDNCVHLGVYNEDKSFQFVFEQKDNKKVFPKLLEKIKTDGVGGLKGYFHAIMGSDKNNIKINVKRMLSSQPW